MQFILSVGRGDFLVRNILSQKTSVRLFHVSNTYKENHKNDPEKYSKFVQGKADIDSIRQFRHLENKIDSVLKDVPMEGIKANLDKYWPEYYKDDQSIIRSTPPPIIEQTHAWDVESTLDPLDLNKELDFAKAMSLISEPQTMKPKTKAQIREHDHSFESRFPIRKILKVGRHAQITAAGRVYSFSVLIMIGTGKGSAGLGYARGNSVPEATALAKKQAEKNLLSLDLWRGNHIGVDIKQRYKRTYVWMTARRPGTGRRCSYELGILLDAFGLTDLSIGNGGSDNKHVLYRAFFRALKDKTRSPEKVARMLGRKLFDRQGAFY